MQHNGLILVNDAGEVVKCEGAACERDAGVIRHVLADNQAGKLEIRGHTVLAKTYDNNLLAVYQ